MPCLSSLITFQVPRCTNQPYSTCYHNHYSVVVISVSSDCHASSWYHHHYRITIPLISCHCPHCLAVVQFPDSCHCCHNFLVISVSYCRHDTIITESPSLLSSHRGHSLIIPSLSPCRGCSIVISREIPMLKLFSFPRRKHKHCRRLHIA